MLPKHINCTIKCCFRILSLFIILIHFYNDMMIMMIMMTCGLLRLPDSSDFNSPGTQGYKLTTTINLCNRTIVILINKSWFEYVGVQFQSADFFLGGVRFQPWLSNRGHPYHPYFKLNHSCSLKSTTSSRLLHWCIAVGKSLDEAHAGVCSTTGSWGICYIFFRWRNGTLVTQFQVLSNPYGSKSFLRR
jgi:hypothetical protein